MKVIHLRGEEYRAWRQNVYVLVGEDGLELRPAAPEEIQGWHVAAQQGLKFTVQVEDIPYVIKTRRDVMKGLYLTEYGACTLKAPNGTTLAVIRDPNQGRAPVPPQGTVLAPHPSQCQCKDWAGTQPGKHHFVCHFNQYAPSDQQGTRQDITGSPATAPIAGSRAIGAAGMLSPQNISRPTTMTMQPSIPSPMLVPQHRQAPPTQTVVASAPEPPKGEVIDGVFVMAGAAPKEKVSYAVANSTPSAARPATRPAPIPTTAQVNIPTPRQCICAQYANKDTGENHHHKWCQFYDAWEQLTRGQPIMLIVDLATGKTLREAGPEEVIEAQGNQERTGVPLITIGDVQYGVIPSDASVVITDGEPVEAESSKAGAGELPEASLPAETDVPPTAEPDAAQAS